MTKIERASAARNANELFDKIIRDYGLKNDSALCRALEVPASRVSMIRSGRTPFTDTMLLIVHEATGMTIKEIKAILRDGVTSHFRVTPWKAAKQQAPL